MSTATAMIAPGQILAVLKEARALIARPKGWTKGAFARPEWIPVATALRTLVPDCLWISEDAVCFCAAGAINRAAYGLLMGDQYRASSLAAATRREIVRLNGLESNLYTWNDAQRRTKKEVVKAFDVAIKKLEEAATR